MKKYILLTATFVFLLSANAQQKQKSKSSAAKHTTTPAKKKSASTVVAAKPEEKKSTDTTHANPNASKINFKEESFTFGEIPEGPQVTHEFKFTNDGKEPLILSTVRASCGCTTPSWPKEPILPGKEAIILVTYNTQGRPGGFTKSITINSNSDTPNKVIYIKGEVIKAEPEKSVPVEGPSLLAPKGN